MKEEKSQIHEFYLTPYPRKLWVSEPVDAKSINDLFETKDGGNVLFSGDFLKGIMKTSSVIRKEDSLNGYLILILSRDALPEHSAHESFHAVCRLFDDMGDGLSYDCQEPAAYMIQYIFSCIEQVRTGNFKKEDE